MALNREVCGHFQNLSLIATVQVKPLVREVIGNFHNLNLLVLLEDLRHVRIAKGAWSTNDDLCPVAHGMEDSEAVHQLRAATQAMSLEAASRYAARRHFAQPRLVYEFVRWWDSLGDSGWLLGELQQLWAERLADADDIQEIIEPIARPVGVPGSLASECSEKDLAVNCGAQTT